MLVTVVAAASLLACSTSRATDAMRAGIRAHQAGQTDDALERYRTALRLEPGVEGAYLNLALVAWDRGRLDQADALLAQEVALHPKSEAARVAHGRVLLAADRPGEALEVLGTAPPIGEHATAWRLTVGLARWQASHGFEAAAEPLRAVIADSAAPDASRQLARDSLRAAAAGEGRWSVVRDLSKGADVTDGAVALLDGLAALHLDALDQARERLEAAVASTPARSPERVVAQHALAVLDSRQGEWAAALARLDAALEAAPPSPDIWLDRAVVLAQLGRQEEAQLAVAGVLRDHGDHPRAAELRELLRP